MANGDIKATIAPLNVRKQIYEIRGLNLAMLNLLNLGLYKLLKRQKHKNS